MEDPLYLHEVVDIVGQGAAPYQDHVIGFDAASAADRGLELAGTWEVMGSTGRWPQVVNLWRLLDGWDGWLRLGQSTNVRRRQNTALSTWWEEAYRHRTGGVDRLLQAIDGSPLPLTAAAAGVRGSVCVHELSTVRPGAGPDYLAAVVTDLAPLAAAHGVRLVGAFEVLLGDTEVCTLWATDLASHAALCRAERGASPDPALVAWAERRRTWCTRWHTELMVTAPRTPLAPSEPAGDG